MSIVEGKGSFRGVPFVTVDHELSGGRRQTTYATPYNNNGAISTDLGRAPRKYRINGFVAGDTFRSQAHALLDALEASGPGTLIHPVYGRLLCFVGDDVSVKESSNEGRLVRFSFAVTEARDTSPSKPPERTVTAVKQAAANVQDIAADVIEDPKRGLIEPPIADWIQDHYAEILSDVLDKARQINGLVSTVTSVPSGIAAYIDTLSTEVAQILVAPGRIGSSFLLVFEQISQAVNRIKAAPGSNEGYVSEVDPPDEPAPRVTGSRGSLTELITAYTSLAEAPPVLGDTPARVEQRQGQIALQTTLRAMALSTAAEAALNCRYDSAQDIRSVRSLLTNALRTLANGEPEPDQELADALRDLASKVSQHLTALAGARTTYETMTILSAEVIAHRLYGDCEFADELAWANKLPNPGVVPAFALLEVWKR